MQGVVQDAFATVLRQPEVRLTVAGRTDAGVHAAGQVAHADLAAGTDLARLLRRVNRMLPADVRLRRLQLASAGFDARFSAVWRRYEYLIADDPTGDDPLQRRHRLAWPRPLDERAMATAAGHLLGLRDFAAFCKQRDGATTVRTLQRFEIERTGHLLVCTVVADAFCHSMVRSLVGALLAVGEGRRAADWPASLLTLDRRAGDVTVAPAHGLTLVEVGYPEPAELAARAAESRARRAPVTGDA